MRFRHLLETAVQIAYLDVGIGDPLAIKARNDSQGTMRGRV